MNCWMITEESFIRITPKEWPLIVEADHNFFENIYYSVATPENNTEHGFGRFLNQIEQALQLMAVELEIEPSKEEIMVRFHQHIAYNY